VGRWCVASPQRAGCRWRWPERSAHTAVSRRRWGRTRQEPMPRLRQPAPQTAGPGAGGWGAEGRHGGGRRSPPGGAGAVAPGCLAVSGKREHRLQQALEAQRRSYLAQKPGPAFARVTERVCGAGIHDHGLAGRCDQSPAAEAEPHRPIKDLERLGLVGMDVHARGRASGFQRHLGDHELAVRVRRCPLKRHRLAGDGVCDRVSGSDHLPLPPVAC
jgi:hypothetical protein